MRDLSVLLVPASLLAAPAMGQAEAPRFEQVRALVSAHCVECHGEQAREGDLDLASFATEGAAKARPDVWTYVRERLVDQDMPPAGHARPDPAAVRAAIAWVDEAFGSEEDAASPIVPGAVPPRRLNHTEYANTVRDLFGIEFDAEAAFGREAVGHGYDTVGDALTIPDLLFEKYIEAAEEIASRVFVSEDRERRRFTAIALDGGGRTELRGEEACMLHTRGEVAAQLEAPRAGRYRIRARVGAHQAGDELARAGLRVGGQQVLSEEVRGYLDPQLIEHEVELVAGPQRVAVAFLNDFYNPELPDPARRDRNLLVAWIEIDGPLDPPPKTDYQAALLERFPWTLGKQRREHILRHLCERVWRLPVNERDVGRLERLGQDQSIEQHLRLALTALLASPRFLLRLEQGTSTDEPQGGSVPSVRPLTGPELAVRLSYLVWSSTPDEALQARALSGELATSEGITRALDDLIADPRARSLATGFGLQWLKLGGLDELQLDPQRYPSAALLEPAMREETVRFLETVLREDRPVQDILDADYTFVNGALAEHYGLELLYDEPPAGAPRAATVRRPLPAHQFTRVSLTGTPRRGVLTHASVLAATSNPTRTSPVKRGRWVLETLLGAPPPDPPPGADSLDESEEAVSARSLRERLELHRADPDCAVCHASMDALGFGLENFDASGAWRTEAGGFPVDASGQLPDGRSFEGPLALIETVREEGAFLRTLTEELLVYALGRGLVREDRRLIASVLEALDPEEATLPDILRAIVSSPAFRQRSL